MENCTALRNNATNNSISSTSIILLQGSEKLFNEDLDPKLSHGSSTDTLNSLSPAFLQCFGIMLLGYVAGRTKFVSIEDSKGINAFLGKIALPALIFCALCTLDLSSVNWTFFVSVLITKSILFVGALLITLAVTKGSLGKAGLFAIFVSMSNDFALGYPLLKSLYGDTQPEYPVYLYIIAPITLVILNPIGFVFLEANQSKNESEKVDEGNKEGNTSLRENKTLKIAIGVIKGLLKNPILIMTVLGITSGRLIVNHEDGKLPALIRPLLECLSASFAAPALFLCGLSMVGRINSIKGGSQLLTVVLLIAGKTFITPFVGRITTSLLMHFHGDNNAEDIQHLSDFSFLYGTFPACPTMYIYATKYGIAPEPVTTAMIFSIFLSVPWMFLSAQFLSLDVVVAQVQTNAELLATILSIVSMIATLLTLLKCILWRKEKTTVRYQFLLVLVSQLVINATFLFWTLVDEDDSAHYSSALIGIHSNKIYITTFLMSVLISVACIKQSWMVEKLNKVFCLCGIVIPVIFVIVFNIFSENKNILKCETDHSNLRSDFLSYLSLFTTITLLPIQVFCLIIIASKNNETEDDFKKTLSSEVGTQHLLASKKIVSSTYAHPNSSESIICEETINNNKVTVSNYGSNCEYLHPSLISENCDDTKNESETDFSLQLLHETVIEVSNANDSRSLDPFSNLNSIYFFFIMIFGCLIEIILCQWNLSNDNISGIYLILLYLHLLFVYGQGILTFLFFFKFSDIKEMINCMFQRTKQPTRSDYLEI